jgi:hypothetical protein
MGFKKQNNLDGAQMAAHRRTEYERPFCAANGKLQDELQWAVVPAYFGFDHERVNIWSKLESRAWGAMNLSGAPAGGGRS